MKKNSKDRFFFDVHMHAFNLSHPGLLAFVNRYLREGVITFSKLFNTEERKGIFPYYRAWYKWAMAALVVVNLVAGFFLFLKFFSSYTEILFHKILFYFTLGLDTIILLLAVYLIVRTILAIRRRGPGIINTLSITENDLGRQFRLIEYDYMSLNAPVKRYLFSKEVDYSSYTEFVKPLKKIWNSPEVEKQFRIDDENVFDKVVLCPLMMDFQHKGYSELDKNRVYYNMPPKKPIIDQCRDLFHGIRDYWKISGFRLLRIFPFMGLTPSEYNLGEFVELSGDYPDGISVKKECNDNELTLKMKTSFLRCFWFHEETKSLWIVRNPHEEALELLFSMLTEADTREVRSHLPFIDFSDNSIARMLLKYFGEYPDRGEDRFGIFLEKYEEHFGSVDDDSSSLPRGKDETKREWEKFSDVGNFFFAGVKVYPPLGFNPWPQREDFAHENDWEQERRKVVLLYRFCEKKGIPIITHCGDGGFEIEGGKTPDPAVWTKVLEAFPELKINFAHFGKQDNASSDVWREWFETILGFIEKYSNVYTDISCHTPTSDSYLKLDLALQRWFNANPQNSREKLMERIIFGTDFMVNLLSVKSYYHYLEGFRSQGIYKMQQRKRMIHNNPHRFLFE